MNILLAVDPGTTESGFVLMQGRRIVQSGVEDNHAMLKRVASSGAETLAIEMIASYGMAVGKEVFQTCVWVGRFQQAWHSPDSVKLVFRKDVKLHLCGSPRAKDANIRASLIDRYGPGKEIAVGNKKNPGRLYGVKSHAWAALAVAVTVSDLP